MLLESYHLNYEYGEGLVRLVTDNLLWTQDPAGLDLLVLFCQRQKATIDMAANMFNLLNVG